MAAMVWCSFYFSPVLSTAAKSLLLCAFVLSIYPFLGLCRQLCYGWLSSLLFHSIKRWSLAVIIPHWPRLPLHHSTMYIWSIASSNFEEKFYFCSPSFVTFNLLISTMPSDCCFLQTLLFAVSLHAYMRASEFNWVTENQLFAVELSKSCKLPDRYTKKIKWLTACNFPQWTSKKYIYKHTHRHVKLHFKWCPGSHKSGGLGRPPKAILPSPRACPCSQRLKCSRKGRSRPQFSAHHSAQAQPCPSRSAAITFHFVYGVICLISRSVLSTPGMLRQTFFFSFFKP